MSSQLSPLAATFQMDSVERALTLGEDVDLVKQQREENVSIAGETLRTAAGALGCLSSLSWCG